MISKVSAYRLAFIASSTSTVVIVVVVIAVVQLPELSARCDRGLSKLSRFRVTEKESRLFPFLACPSGISSRVRETSLSDCDVKNTADGYPI